MDAQNCNAIHVLRPTARRPWFRRKPPCRRQLNTLYFFSENQYAPVRNKKRAGADAPTLRDV